MVNYAGIKNCVAKYSEMTGENKKESEKRLKDFLTVFSELLLDPKIEGLQFVNFITMRKVVRKAKLGRNPLTNEIYNIPERIGIKTELGLDFNSKLNK